MRYCYTFLFFALFIVGNIFSQSRPPEVPADDPYFKMGYLDVRLFGADSTGTTICTQQIRNAIKAAQTYKLACYFPSGTYLIDDSVRCVMPITRNGDLMVTDRREPVYIVGADNPRPVIKLAPGALGYGAGTKKPMFHLLAYEASTGNIASNITFNMVVRNMVFDLSGYRGAVGLSFAGAQGSTVEDVKVIATGSFAGFYNCPGQGGGSYNIEVIGGDYAWYIADDNSRFINMTGIECRDQLIEVFKIIDTNRPMLVSGFHFVKQSGAILSGWPSGGGGISFVDGIVEYTGTSTNAFLVPSNNLYIENVYFKNCDKIVLNNNASALTSGSWNRVAEYIFTGTGGSSLINGATVNAGTSSLKSFIEDAPAPIEITRKHTWDPLTFVSISMRNETGFVNVKDEAKMTGPAGPALGNGTKNDTKSIQWAIDHFDKVFLPKGTYMIDSTLVLKSNTQLFGAGKTYSVIRPLSPWKTAVNRVMISTVSDVNATTSLSFILLETNPSVYQDLSRIEWKAGPGSMIRDIMIGGEYSKTEGSLYHYLLKLSGPTAGGKFYSFTCENMTLRLITKHPDYRAVLIENTHQPIRFYGYNSERIFANTQFEIKNSSDVKIFYFKSEANATEGQAQQLLVSNSTDVRLYCMSGNIKPRSGRAMIETVNTSDFLASTVKSSHIEAGSYNAKEVFNSVTKYVNYNLSLCVFSRDTTVANPLSIETINESPFIVYPNPVKETITIDTKNQTGCKASIFSFTGKLQHETALKSGIQVVDISSINQGPFLLKISGMDGNFYCFKMIKE